MQDILDQLQSKTIARTVRKHSILLYQGEVPRSAYYLKKGVMKVYSINSVGAEQIVAFYTAGDLFPISWIFDKTTSTLYYYEAMTDCTVLAIDKKALREVLNSRPDMLAKVFDYVMTNYTSSLLRITSLEQSRAGEKIMFTLYYLVFRYGREIKPGIYSIQMNLTHTVIADMVGIARETTAVEMNKLKKANVVQYNSKEYIVDRKKLERAMGEDTFNALQG
ncbi:MAG TPA: Crp/Fnr family transcriptional regulator [Patescibacteria group bacterium]|nr:Crp/Fnr family transcriptional regulator [Patescibacteria group bacterium]